MTSPRNSRKARRREQVRGEILAATRKVVVQRGVAGLTLTAVARELQLTKAALYHYFDSKDAMVREVLVETLSGHAEEVGAAVDATRSGADAIEALIRTSARYFSSRRDELRLSYLVPQVGSGGATPIDAETLARIRPHNDRIYGGVAARIDMDQRAGRANRTLSPRRLAFLAHTSVLGLLTMEGLVEAADTAPLIHPHHAMIDDLVAVFRGRLAPER